MDEINKQQKCCDHTKEIEEINLEHQKSIQIMLKSKTDDILFLLDENQRLLENERKFIKKIKILKEKNKKLSNELLNANKKTTVNTNKKLKKITLKSAKCIKISSSTEASTVLQHTQNGSSVSSSKILASVKSSKASTSKTTNLEKKKKSSVEMADKRNEIKKQIKAKISLLEKAKKLETEKNCDDINFCNYEGYNGDTEYEFCDHLEDSVSLAKAQNNSFANPSNAKTSDLSEEVFIKSKSDRKKIKRVAFDYKKHVVIKQIKQFYEKGKKNKQKKELIISKATEKIYDKKQYKFSNLK